ncbi:hypothetical protein P5V15_001326 [Pogonomyrmex californicus]
MGQKTWQSDFVTRQCAVSHSKTSERNRLDGTSFRTRRTPQTWRHLTITSSHQWGTRSQSSTSAISRKLENGSTNGLPQKTSSFSGMVFINYLKDVRNV